MIGAGVCIGRGCVIGPNAVLGFALLGDRVHILGGAVIGEQGFGIAAGGGRGDRRASAWPGDPAGRGHRRG